MYILISLFAGSLFLIAIFFAIKEREAYTGRVTSLTNFLVRRSPGAEMHVARLREHLTTSFNDAWLFAGHLYERGVGVVVWGTRALVVLVAERMIHAVKGEKLFSSKSASSMFLKHLKEHKDNISNDRGTL